MLERLKKEAAQLGKPSWRAMLGYVAQLHERSIHAPVYPFTLPWEEIGPGYFASPAFGHWDIVHQIMDVLPSEPEHAANQIINNLTNQTGDGMVPGSIWMKSSPPRWSKTVSHPPIWPVAAQEYYEVTGSLDILSYCFDRLLRQIEWFENTRKAEPEGYYYLDILNRSWESGVDEGVRFDESPQGPYACIDATSHVYWLYDHACKWAEVLRRDPSPFRRRAQELADFIQNELFDSDTGFFHDVWAVGNPKLRHLTFEGMWPVVVGAASPQQAERVINENLVNEARFFTKHPISSVVICDPKFELRCWRGPAWNSMTYWAAWGCVRYGFRAEARAILENALDDSARQFAASGTIWEFYHPHGGDPLTLARKPQTGYNHPCPDYLGHNPLIAMARLWQHLCD
ncbi:MAG: trehalase family glycosidase [Armatimonadota bacterium]|nr:trehalase family glycosidase [Armatimonadota bacterium]